MIIYKNKNKNSSKYLADRVLTHKKLIYELRSEETPEVATNSGMSNISLLPFTLDHPHLRTCHIHHSRCDQRAMFVLITIKPVGHVST